MTRHRPRAFPIALILAAVACEAGPRGQQSVMVAATGSTAIVEPPPDLAPLARPGEQMRYRVSIHGVELAEFALVVGEPAVVDGVDVIAVQAVARTTKVAAWLSPEANEFTSWVDRKTGRPVLFRSAEPASRTDRTLEVTESRFAGGQIQVNVTAGPDAPVQLVQALRNVGYDFNSFLMFLRAWEGGTGARLDADVVRSRFAWRASFNVAGYENLPTTLGQMAVVRIDGEGVRINRDGSVDATSDRRRLSIWISDDADRVPVRLTARTDYGDIVMDLVAYAPGRVN